MKSSREEKRKVLKNVTSEEMPVLRGGGNRTTSPCSVPKLSVSTAE